MGRKKNKKIAPNLKEKKKEKEEKEEDGRGKKQNK